jgi:hypothetical protein
VGGGPDHIRVGILQEHRGSDGRTRSPISLPVREGEGGGAERRVDWRGGEGKRDSETPSPSRGEPGVPQAARGSEGGSLMETDKA